MKNNPVVLVSIVQRFRGVEDRTRPPSGLLYVGGALKKAGFDARIFHIYEREIDDTVLEIMRLNPLCVGFSVFTGYSSYVSAVMSEKIKIADKSVPVVWGGVHPSLAPEQCLESRFIDFVVVGEGEETMTELARALAEGKDTSPIQGVGYKAAGDIKINPNRPQISNLDDYGMDWSLVNIKDYVRMSGEGKKTMCFIASRGCRFNCGFCYNSNFHGRRWRAPSIDFVVKEIVKMKELTGMESVVFDDDNFFGDLKRGLTILSELNKKGVFCDWLDLRLEIINRENMQKIKDAGVRSVFFGWESGSDRILRLIGKGFNRATILDKCEVLADFPEIRYDASAIIGFPTETFQETRETVETALKMSEILPNVNFNIGTYMPYPGTRLYQTAIDEGFEPPKSVLEWKEYDILEGRIELKWIKWADKGTRRRFYLLDKYARFLDRSPRKGKTLRSFAKLVLYFIARFRLKRDFLFLPFEVALYNMWSKREIRKRLSSTHRVQ